MFYWVKLYQKRNDLFFEKELAVAETRGSTKFRMKRANFKFRNFWSYLDVKRRSKTLYYLPFFFLRKFLYALGFVLLNYNLNY